LPVLFVALVCGAAWPAMSLGADPAADKKAEDAAREKLWDSPEMLQARAWLENYFRLTKKYSPEKAAAYRQALKNMSAAEMELWLIKFEHDRQMSRDREAAWEQQHRAAVARDEAQLARERQALQSVNRGNNQAAAAEENAITRQRQEAERNFRQNEADASQLLDEYNRPYTPYFYYGGYGPTSVHYHFHR
jgi:hypothetical protein